MLLAHEYNTAKIGLNVYVHGNLKEFKNILAYKLNSLLEYFNIFRLKQAL